MATEELKKASEQLQIVEREAGADLADLRGLSEANGRGSAARSQLENVKTELRQVETLHASLQSELALLKDTQSDPHLILSAPASILSPTRDSKSSRRFGRCPAEHLATPRSFYQQPSARQRCYIG